MTYIIRTLSGSEYDTDDWTIAIAYTDDHGNITGCKLIDVEKSDTFLTFYYCRPTTVFRLLRNNYHLFINGQFVESIKLCP